MDAKIGARNTHREPVSQALLRVVIYDDAATDREMDRAVVQQLVRRGINDRRLPRGRAMGIREMLGDGRPCDACEEPIVPGEKLVLAMVPLDWMSVRFHVDCYQVWEAHDVRERPSGWHWLVTMCRTMMTSTSKRSE